MRKLSSYEINHLLKFGFDPVLVSKDIDENIPIEYFTGKCDFLGKTFNINKNVLIPRIETEEIIQLGLKHLIEEFIRFADIGTGSGCIGISFAKELIKRKVSFEGILSDISELALEVCKINLKEILKNDSRIEIIKSDLLNSYLNEKKLDIVFANLPYIPLSRMNDLQKSIKDFEPSLALYGGNDGLALIRKLLNSISKYLNENGVVLLEVDDTHLDIKEFIDIWNITKVKDLNDKNRFWICKLKKLSP